MAWDIALCPGGACPQRDNCYRHRAAPDARQDWLTTPPYDPATGACSLFWDLRSVAPSDDDVRFHAYLLWEREGRPEGRADAHWRAARASLDAAFAARLAR